MIVKYDALNRLEKPKLTLCNPGSVRQNDGTLTKVVGILANCEAEEVIYNFNATSELNFRVNKVAREDPWESNRTYESYQAVKNRRLIFLDNIGYFMITSIEDGYENGAYYKDVKAQSIDIEIQQKMIPFINNGTYRFLTSYTDTTPPVEVGSNSTEEISTESLDDSTDSTGGISSKGILETIVEVLPLWTIGEVDNEVAQRWRTFEDVDTSLNCLSFLIENIQDAYECIIIFDTVNRIINVYDQANYVRRTNIHITKEDVINSIDITENADDLYTAINVLGDDDVTIAAINPTGTNVLYDFSYYLSWMTPELSAKVSAWQTAVEEAENSEAENSYYNLNLNYYTKLAAASNLQAEINRLNTQITMYQRCCDNIVAESSTNLVESYNGVIVSNGGTAIEIRDEISDTIDEIKGLIEGCYSSRDRASGELLSLNSDIESLHSQIQVVHDRLFILNYFTNEEYEELRHYIFEGSYKDEYVVLTDVMTYKEKFEQMKTLYDRAKFRLNRVSSPTQEFDLDVENFIFAKDFERWSEQLETGCLINVELDTNDIALLFLSSISINYDDHNLKMTFGNRFNKFDPKSLFENILGDVSRSANTLDYIKEILYPIRSGEFNSMKEALQTSRNITMSSALASTGEEVIIDGSGYTGKRLLDNGEYDRRQVKITGKSIVFTDDAWDSCKVAIGELILGENGESAYGVNAETIVGDIIMGNNLRILDNSGNDLLSAVDGKITAKVSDVRDDVSALRDQVAVCVTSDQLDIAVKNVSVDSVTTTTGYTFNSEGLIISKSDEEMKNVLDNHGMSVSRAGEDVLIANNEGVNAINLTARQYLTIGQYSRFEDYAHDNDHQRTACFYIGT